MPSYVIKPHRDKDQYVYWSEIVDAPHCWGTREEILTYLQELDAGPIPEQRMDRADEFGTSALWGSPRIYSFDDENRSVIYEQRGTVKVENLWDFCNSLLAAGPEWEEFITPFEDDESEMT